MAFDNTRSSISAICVPACAHASSASGVQQLERPCTSQTTKSHSTASTLISACLKHAFQKDIPKRARYENSPFLSFFFPQIIVNLSCLGCFSDFRLYLFQNTAEIYMFHEDSTTIRRITSHILKSVTINQTKQGIFNSSFVYQGLSLIMFEFTVIQFDSVPLLITDYVPLPKQATQSIRFLLYKHHQLTTKLLNRS